MIEEKLKTIINSKVTDGVAIMYYTDPLCCWSWAMEKEWQQFRNVLPNNTSIRYCMGGLIPDWNSYHDPVNAISRPVQMGPLWMEVRYRTGAQLHDRIWMQDAPASSYPACIAVKAAALQGKQYEEKMLLSLREAVMVEGKNIAKNSVLIEVAATMSEGFDKEQFKQDLFGQSGVEAFKKDLEEIRLQQVMRFPSIKISTGGRAIMITGYRKYEVLMEGFEKLCQE